METRDFPSLEEIARIPDIMEGLDICEEFDMPYDGLETLEEIKERLVLEWRRRNEDPVKPEVGLSVFCCLWF